MWPDDPWAPWGLTYTTRDGTPVVTATGLWYLAARHPEAVERVSDSEYRLYLERPYRAVRPPDRDFFRLTPGPHRERGAPGGGEKP